jgi:cytochrome P450
VLRVRPVLSVTPRRVAEPIEVAGWTLPAGVDVAPCIWLAHRDVRSHRDPAAFRPERWLEGPPAPGTYIPWGGGTRRCAGAAFAAMELREVLRAVAATVDLAPAGRVRGEAVRRRSVTLAPARGGMVHVSARRRA